MTKLSKVLIALEKDRLLKQAGKSLDEIEVPLEKGNNRETKLGANDNKEKQRFERQ